MENAESRPAVAFVAASPYMVEMFLASTIREVADRYQVTVITNCQDADFMERLGVPARLVHVPIDREIRLLRDLLNLARMVVICARARFRMVHSISPKAGLLIHVAAWLTRVPVRIHTFTGQVWATAGGFRRWLLKHVDRITAFCVSDILADSASQARFLEAEGVVASGECGVIGAGSMGGIGAGRTDGRSAAEGQPSKG